MLLRLLAARMYNKLQQNVFPLFINKKRASN